MKKLTFSELVDKHLVFIVRRGDDLESATSEELTMARKAAFAEMENHG